MEIRRVQMTGGASFVVTLPKEWAEGQKIKKNDPVGLIVQPDGTLLVTKKITEDPIQRVKEIDSSNITDPAFLFRMLIGTYITGFHRDPDYDKTAVPAVCPDCCPGLHPDDHRPGSGGGDRDGHRDKGPPQSLRRCRLTTPSSGCL